MTDAAASTRTTGDRSTLARFALVSVAAALVTIALKVVAWRVTGSVGLLSDALESIVNLFAAVVALTALRISARPADERHPYGHAKVEHFAAGAEGTLILIAAVTIGWSAIDRLLHPVAIGNVRAGIVVAIVASVINLAVGRWLVRLGRTYRSATLEADGRHLLTDVWTSVGVVVGVVVVSLTGVRWLDPVIALLVAANIVYTGLLLLRTSMGALMDEALPPEQLDAVTRVLDRLRTQGHDYHALRTRVSGHRAFMSVHLLVPGDWSVRRGHDLAEQLDRALCEEVPSLTVVVHVEPIEDAVSFEDVDIRD